MSLEEILDAGSDLKLGKEWVIAAIKLPVPQAGDTFWSHKVGWATVSRLRIFSVSVCLWLCMSLCLCLCMCMCVSVLCFLSQPVAGLRISNL